MTYFQAGSSFVSFFTALLRCLLSPRLGSAFHGNSRGTSPIVPEMSDAAYMASCSSSLSTWTGEGNAHEGRLEHWRR